MGQLENRAMTAHQLTRFAEILAALGETFNEPISEVRVNAYTLALADLEPEAVLTAMVACLRDCKFFPRPAEIREKVLGNTADQAELAWSQTVQAVQRVGYLRTPDLPPATMQAIRNVWGSWGRLCETLPAEGTELLGWRKAFMQAYGAAARATMALPEATLTERSQLAPGVRALLQRVK